MKISIYNVKDEPIGRGGMGQVYLGWDEKGNTVAIKEMLSQYVTDPSLRQRFHQEVNILSQLEHQSIIKMYASFEERGNLYLVMEYVEGVTIDQYVQRHGVLSEKEATRILSEILSALGYAHSKGYVHRDIKPSNIMIRSNGSVSLLDFGIAKDMARAGTGSGLTTTIGTTIGTVGYMSPEQAEGLSIDHRSDIYSLGCVLFYMLTGQHAIKEESNEIKTRIAIINNPFPKAKLYNPNISDRVQRILDKATDKNMTKRFQLCEEFEAELQKLISNISVPPPIEQAEAKTKGRKNIIIGVVVGICAIIALAIWLFLPTIQYGLGEKHYKKEQFAEAVKYFRKAAERGDAEAKTKLGICYAKGNGIAKDTEQAVFWWRSAAEQGNAEAKYNLGDCYYYGNGVSEDYEKAVHWFRDAAEQGYDNAQFWLGRCYYYGEGVAIDYEEAMKWYLKAAEQGHARAHFNIGILYEYELIPNANKDEAKHWYKKAVELYTIIAEQGDAEFQWRLGNCYYNGYGVDKNDYEAEKWYRKADEQGFENASLQMDLGNLYYDGYDGGDGVLQNYVKAANLFRKAAKLEYVPAQHNLGICYYNGYGVEKDYTQACEWFRKAAEQEFAKSQYLLGVCYENGYGVIKNAAQAVDWYRKAAEQQFAEAQYKLGKCYDFGIGVNSNYTQSANWYRKAAEQGQAKSQYELGLCYRSGWGVKKDGNTALYWFEKAIQNEDESLSDTGLEEVRKEINSLKTAGYSSSYAIINEISK